MSKIVSNKLALTAILLTTVIAFSINSAYAQELGTPAVPSGDGIALDDVFEVQNLIQVGIAFVLGGIGWAILGWQKHRRQEGTPFSYTRLGKTCVVGIGIGVFSLAVMVYTDSSIEHLYATTMHGFLQLVVWSFMCVTTTAAVAKKLFPDAFDKINYDSDLKPTTPSGEKKSLTEWYLTNFKRGSRGNKLPYGQRELKIKIKDAEWVAGRLAMKKDSGWNIIQIEQTGTKNNPWKDKIVFEMLKIQNGKIIPLPPGEYMVKVSAQRGTGITSVEDVFYVS